MRRRLLLALYPAWWRRQYGEEARAVLEEASLGPRGVLDILRGAVDAWLRQRPPHEGLFARWTDDACQALVYAQDEARGLRHNYLGTEHVLLGLLAARESVAARALVALGVSPELVRARLLHLLRPASPPPAKSRRRIACADSPLAAGWTRVTPRAKRGFELARREADGLGHERVGPEHLLLGLLGERQGIGMLILTDLGVDPARLREQIARSLRE